MNLKLKKADFLMAKRLKRRFALQHKDRPGCMSSIAGVFDFRHGRVTRRMLSDYRAHTAESTTGSPSCPTSEVNSLMDSEEIHPRIESPNNEKIEMALTRVKELMEEEMQCDQTEKTSQYCDLEHLMNNLLLIHQKKPEEQNPKKSLERSNSLEHENEPVTRKNRNFFRRRSKSHECLSLNENEFHNEHSVSPFSFTEIKKKLKNAIGRSPRDPRCHEKPVVDGNNEWSSPNKDRFYSERFSRISKREDGVSRFCKSERITNENNEFGDTSDRISNIYIEAKKHLHEMLKKEDEDIEVMVESHSRTLGKLLDFPGYNSLSSGIGPRNKLVVNESQPCGDSPTVNESQQCVTNDEHQEMEVSDEVHQGEDVIEIVTPPPSPQEIEAFDASELSEENQITCSPIVSPSGSSSAINKKPEVVESVVDDRTGKPSPVSVLEPLFSDDDISPARTISRSAEASIQPLRIRFEETVTRPENQETCIHNHVENEESVFEYIEALLLASDLNWDEFEKRWLSSFQILDASLYDELQIFSSRPNHDQRLLFDSTNEILKEICDRSLGFFPELINLKPSMHPIPKGMDLINEVWERIESRLNCHYRSLDQLISKDLEVSRMWMDVCSESREIVMETEERIFEDMIDDIVLSLMYDYD